MAASSKPTLAFFGATGGTTASALALALKDGYFTTALARTPTKLRTLMENQYNIPPATLDAQLQIIQGSAKDIEVVKETLAPQGKHPALIVISGLGAYPEMSIKPPFIVNTDPTLCGDAMTVLMNALRQLRREGRISEAQKPLVYVGSTTGLSAKRDVPYALAPLYHVVLASAHKDKTVMETVLAEASTEMGPEAPISNFVIGRPTLLMDGPAKGLSQVKTGWEKHPAAPNATSEKETAAAIGYTIRRSDVGAWIFEKVIKGGHSGNPWAGKCVSMTY
ncbi:hypothetical protein E6O75_ATG01422 [Venturia nashicola]|uniref:NAD(P)-binding domain-containing protein n=1 Tax=Venturia nashicola TaxID=86259 RepID=A0A4Z1PVA2_9PEZI|nr:hypothetical protein E6O75_ATG01422 [Venturia nashicola]